MKSTAHVDQIFHGRFLDIDLHGKLSRRDYEKLVPETERLILQCGKLRILVTMHEFDGWDAGGMWEEIKWDARHFNDIERLAIVGDEIWHKWMAGFCKPFTTATIQYFTFDRLADAYAWLEEG